MRYRQQSCQNIGNSLSHSHHSIEHKKFVINQRDRIGQSSTGEEIDDGFSMERRGVGGWRTDR